MVGRGRKSVKKKREENNWDKKKFGKGDRREFRKGDKGEVRNLILPSNGKIKDNLFFAEVNSSKNNIQEKGNTLRLSWKGDKGEVSVFFIVTIILAIMGFIAIMFFVLNFFNGGVSGTDEVCKLSVLTRASAPSSVQGYVPLKCQTKKICLTQSWLGTCSQFAGEKDVQRVVLPSGKEKEKIEEISANAMYDCWNMMGQGKMDLFQSLKGEVGLKPTESACVICSRVAIGKDVKEEVILKVNINEYMRTHNPPNSDKTYLQTFTDKSVRAYPKVEANSQFSQLGKGKIEKLGTGKKIEVSGSAGNREMAMVFMQIKTPSVEDVLTNMVKYGGSVTAGVFMMPVIGNLAKAIVFSPVGGTLTAVAAVGMGVYGTTTAWEGQRIAAGYCGEFTSSLEKAKAGCSLVQGLNYNTADINQLCQQIEGSP